MRKYFFSRFYLIQFPKININEHQMKKKIPKNNIFEKENNLLTVIVRRTECVFLNRPSRWENNEVSDCGAWSMALACQYSEYAWILSKRIFNILKANYLCKILGI